MGDVQDSQCVSASEMTYIVSGGALNSTNSTRFCYLFTYLLVDYVSVYFAVVFRWTQFVALALVGSSLRQRQRPPGKEPTV